MFFCHLTAKIVKIPKGEFFILINIKKMTIEIRFLILYNYLKCRRGRSLC